MALDKVDARGISRLSTEYLYWPIVSDEDFSDANAYVAFVVGDEHPEPVESPWVPASIVENPDDAEQQAVELLVGPDGEDLSPADQNMVVYRVWVRLDTGIETQQDFVRQAGRLAVR